MQEKRRESLKELAARLIGERADELLDYAEREQGVTLVSKSGQKFRITRAALEDWRWETAARGPETDDGGRKAEVRGQKRGAKR
jgi:hypothetical protein